MPYPPEGSIEWYEAVARGYRRCAEAKKKFVIPLVTAADQFAKADEAQAKADALRKRIG